MAIRPIRLLTFDAKKTLRGNFKPSTPAERAFYQQLKKVAQASGHIVEQYARPGAEVIHPREMQRELERYAKKLEPWARSQSAKMVEQVMRSNKRAYENKSRALGIALREGFGESDVYLQALKLVNEQVGLIKSIPTDAGLRAQKIALEATLKGARAQVNTDTVSQLENELGLTTEVAVSRALLIARTEVARSNAVINQTRAQAVGSRQYRWHNSGDGAVRESHRIYHGKKLQGMVFSWDSPPTLDDGMTGHPGEFPNCRCFAEPIFDQE